jgi:hypothetical protein
MKEIDLNKFTKPVIGIILMNAKHDSEGDPIWPQKFYHVAKDTETGKIIILKANKQ